jgi:hypothetical protein
MSLQIAILKALSGRPSGRASVSDLNSDLAFFNSIGAEWTSRMSRLAARAPALDIFGQGLVTRDTFGWQLTLAGRVFLTAIEVHERAPLSIEDAPAVVPVAVQHLPVANVVNLDDHRRRRRGLAQETSPAQQSTYGAASSNANQASP